MSGNAKRRREAKRERRTSSYPRRFRDVPRAEALEALSALCAGLGPGIHYAEIEHDPACPCAGNRGPFGACTCVTVNVGLGGRLQ